MCDRVYLNNIQGCYDIAPFTFNPHFPRVSPSSSQLEEARCVSASYRFYRLSRRFNGDSHKGDL
jgi:hypothetical protein